MSLGVFRYSRPNAQLRAMISRLLTPEQLRALSATRDLEGVLRSLQETAYGPVSARLLERGAGLADVERAVLGTLVEAYRRTASLVGGDGGRLVAEMARRLEVENLKAILRARARGESPDVVRPLLVPLGRLSRLPVSDLLQAEDVDAVASALADANYGPVLQSALPRYAAEGSLFPVEIALDLHYYRRLWSAVQRLSGRDLQMVTTMMGTRCDLLNLDWIIRYRLIYRLSPEEIFNYTLPYGHRVDDAVVRRAASAEGMEGIAGAAPEPYRSLLSQAANAADPVDRASVLLHRHLVSVARSALAGYPFHLGIAVAHLWLKEAEVHDLRAVLEATRYDLSPDVVAMEMWGVA